MDYMNANLIKRMDNRPKPVFAYEIKKTGVIERIVIDAIHPSQPLWESVLNASKHNDGEVDMDPNFTWNPDYIIKMVQGWRNMDGADLFKSVGFSDLTIIDVKNSWAWKAGWKEVDLKRLEENPEIIFITSYQTGLSKTRTQTVPNPWSKWFFVTSADVKKIRAEGEKIHSDIRFGNKETYSLNSTQILRLFKVFDMFPENFKN